MQPGRSFRLELRRSAESTEYGLHRSKEKGESSVQALSRRDLDGLTLDPVGVLYRAAIFVQSLSQVSLKARKKPAVDRNRRPSDRRRIVRCEKQNGFGDLLRLNQPTKWMSLRQLGQMGLWIWR